MTRALCLVLLAIAPWCQAEEGKRVPDTAFSQYHATDAFGRKISYFVSDAGPKPLPLLVFIHGSGGQPLFTYYEPAERNVGQSGQGSIVRALAGKARVMVIEKPGSEHLAKYERPGSAEHASPLFRSEHTLPRWSSAIQAAIKAALQLPGVDRSRLCVSGHSEGGLVACHVAARMPEVTHVVSLAGGGVTQLFDLAVLAREGHMYGHAASDPEQRVAALLRQYQAVLDDPDSAEKLFLGHPHRRWSSFLATSPANELRDCKARMYIGQGELDTATSVHSFDALHMELLALGKDVTADRVVGADHSFRLPNEQPGQGWQKVWERIGAWYLSEARPPASSRPVAGG